MPSIDLLPDQSGLFRGVEAGMGPAFDGMRETGVRTVTGLAVLRTSASWFAALDRAFGKGTATHGLGIG